VSTPTTSPSVLVTAAAADGDRCAADDSRDEMVPMLGLYDDLDDARTGLDLLKQLYLTDGTCFGHGVRKSTVSLYTT